MKTKNLFMRFLISVFMPFTFAMYIVEGEGGAGADVPTEKEKALFGKIEAKMKEFSEKESRGLIKKEYFDDEMKKLTDQLDALKESSKTEGLTKSIEDLKLDIQKQIDEAGLSITKLKETGVSKKTVTLEDAIAKALQSDEFKEFNDRGQRGQSKGIQLKDVTMGGFTNDVVTPERKGPEVAFLGPKKFDIRAILSGGTSDVDVLDHIKETGYSNAAGFLAENAASAESTLNLQQVKTTSVRMGTHIDVSKKALRNTSFLINHLTNRFNEQLIETLNNSIINGDGTSNTVDGLFNNATTFTAGTLASTVDSANTADVISAALCRLSEITNLRGTAIFMNPKDVYGVKVTKSSTGEYVESAVMVERRAGQLYIDGVPVFDTFHVSADAYLVGDYSATSLEWYETQGLTMSVSEQHDTNFIKNLVTFNFEIEGLLPIYKTFAFLKGTISTDKAAIDSGS